MQAHKLGIAGMSDVGGWRAAVASKRYYYRSDIRVPVRPITVRESRSIVNRDAL